LFERATQQVVDMVTLPRAVFCLDMSPDTATFALGGTEQSVRLYEIKNAAK